MLPLLALATKSGVGAEQGYGSPAASLLAGWALPCSGQGCCWVWGGWRIGPTVSFLLFQGPSLPGPPVSVACVGLRGTHRDLLGVVLEELRSQHPTAGGSGLNLCRLVNSCLLFKGLPGQVGLPGEIGALGPKVGGRRGHGKTSNLPSLHQHPFLCTAGLLAYTGMTL